MDISTFVELAHRHAHRTWARDSAKIGLSHSEYEYLRAIKDQEAARIDKDDHGQHLADVVADMGVHKASASAMVVKLEDRGLVTRIPCQFDARAQHILLTDQGRNLLSEGNRLYETAAARVFAGLSKSDERTISDILHKIG